ncbi:Diaminopropionate ammonia-lyase (EC 4.3.1.15) [Azospirillum argentinense]|uniref:hypothetical protein n=1 Tax=Azospirillum argentinense TaxID=2970906 RepID=UPI0032DF659F
MLLLNRHPAHRKPLIPAHAALLGAPAADEVERFLAHRPNHAPTPLHGLPALADELRVGSIHIKDEGQRLGLGSFKALGGSYAVIRLVLEQAPPAVSAGRWTSATCTRPRCGRLPAG